MKIAICDIDRDFLYNFKNTIYRYADLHRMEFVVDCFVSGEGILQTEQRYNLIFLGNRLRGIGGLETAEKLRKNNVLSVIVFVSDCVDFVFDAFKVEAYRFLLKDTALTDVVDVLDDLFKKFGRDYPLWVKSGEDVVCLNTNEIYYLEADNKHCNIHLKDRVLTCNRTMARVFALLPKGHFSKANRAFIVNLNHIRYYNNDVIVLKNGGSLHPSRNYYKNFKDDYRRFLRPYEV